MKKILLTGGSSMIGGAIRDRLSSVDAIGGICVSYPKKYSLVQLS